MKAQDKTAKAPRQKTQAVKKNNNKNTAMSGSKAEEDEPASEVPPDSFDFFVFSLSVFLLTINVPKPMLKVVKRTLLR